MPPPSNRAQLFGDFDADTGEPVILRRDRASPSLAAAGLRRTRDGDRTRVWELGDSITHRRWRTLAAVPTVVSGNTATFTFANSGAILGGRVRVISEADVLRTTFGLVSAVTAADFTVTWPMSVVGLMDASVNLYLHDQQNDTGWSVYADALLSAQGRDCELVETYAVGGAQVAEMLARLRAFILPECKPGDILRVMGGVNDLEVTATPAIIASLASICAEAQAAGLVVHLGTVTPAGSAAYYANPAAALAQLAQVNGAIRMMGRRYASVRVWDGHAALVSGSYAAAGTTEAGGVHLTPVGAALVGARYVADVGADIGKSSDWRWMGPQDDYTGPTSQQLLTNAAFDGAAGATGPTGWTVAGSANAWSIAAHASGCGNDLTLTKSATGGNSTTLAQDITARVSAGQRIRFGTELETVTVGQGHYVLLELVCTVGGIEQVEAIGRQQYTVAQGGRLPPAGSRWRFVADGVIPPGATSVVLRYTIRQDSSGSMAVRLAHPFARRVA